MKGASSTILLAALSLLTLGAKSEPIDTVEWLAATADVVVTGTIQNVETIAEPPGYFGDKATIRVTRTLKGIAREIITVQGEEKQQYSLRTYQYDGGEYLFFVLRSDNIPRDHQDPKARDILTLVDPDKNVISLDRLPTRPLISCTFQTLNTPVQILAAASVQGPPAATRERVIYPPTNSPAGRALAGIFNAPLRIPDDDRWKRPYMEFNLKWNGYLGLSISRRLDLKCPQTIDLLKRELQDPTWVKLCGPWNRSIVSFEKRFYLRRAKALRILNEWNAAPSIAPVIEEPFLPRRPFSPTLLSFPSALMLLLLFPRRIPFPTRLRNFAIGLLATLAVLVTFFYARSLTRYDDFIFATPAAEWEISSLQGKLQVLYIADRPVPHPPVIGSVLIGDFSNVPTHIACLYPFETASYLKIDRETGLTPAISGTPYMPKPSNAFKYHLVRVPYGLLLIASSLLPALCLFRSLRRRRLVRHRQLANLCVACGYDLRASSGRCPECGNEMTRKTN